MKLLAATLLFLCLAVGTYADNSNYNTNTNEKTHVVKHEDDDNGNYGLFGLLGLLGLAGLLGNRRVTRTLDKDSDGDIAGVRYE